MYKFIFITVLFFSSGAKAANTVVEIHDTTLIYTIHVYDSLPKALEIFCKGYKISTEKKQLYYARAFLHNGQLFFKANIMHEKEVTPDKCLEEYYSLEGKTGFAKGGKTGMGCGACLGMLVKAKIYNVKINIIII